jgi:hypothetical protein
MTKTSEAVREDSALPKTGFEIPALHMRRVATWPAMRALAWQGDVLYCGRSYEIVRRRLGGEFSENDSWEEMGRFVAPWWRNLTARNRWSARLVRDGFHTLVVVREPGPDAGGEPWLIGAVPGAIVTRASGDDRFRVTHRVKRGTRPLHLAGVLSEKDGAKVYWGEYFDNREREEVHIYVSSDQGQSWQVGYTFRAGSIRHVHNIVYDRWQHCLWILTGDEGEECRILCASCDLGTMDLVLKGNQQTRSAAAVATEDGLFFSTDTPFEQNHIYLLRRSGRVEKVGDLASSSIFGCSVRRDAGQAMFFSTMIEPSKVNRSREVQVVGSGDGKQWQVMARWKKDALPMRYFQYGNALLPDGENATRYLAVTTVATSADDLVTTLWEVVGA